MLIELYACCPGEFINQISPHLPTEMVLIMQKQSVERDVLQLFVSGRKLQAEPLLTPEG